MAVGFPVRTRLLRPCTPSIMYVFLFDLSEMTQMFLTMSSQKGSGFVDERRCFKLR